MSDKVQVLKARTPFDRRLARIEQQVVWENAAGSVRENLSAAARLEALAEDAVTIGRAVGATPTIQLRAISAASDCLAKAAAIRTSTTIDRTIPALSRAEVAEVIHALPAPDDEINAGPVITDEEKARRESIALMRSAIALLERGGDEYPGLVLLKREATS